MHGSRMSLEFDVYTVQSVDYENCDEVLYPFLFFSCYWECKGVINILGYQSFLVFFKGTQRH